MATEKYLLGELPAELRDAFEEHFFDCPECAMDVRAAAVFLDEAKVQLPELAGPLAAPSPASQAVRTAAVGEKKEPWWSILLRPALAGPVFAALLVTVGYQNLVTFPGLRASANAPLLAPTLYLHAGTRGGNTAVEVDARHGIALIVDRPQQAGFLSYRFELFDPAGKLVAGIDAPGDGQNADGQAGNSEAGDGTLSLAIPGAGLRDGAYTLAISGVTSDGARTEIERHGLDFHIRN